ncbi:hypothetical protein [Methylibium sp.]|jgi:hypothetical protein|uniref:hypothetical protein n=1 Tax=Methylibium sp. TaxID=2067992 RepID=UPI003D0B7757
MTSHPIGGGGDPARDAHLRAALRHAPDRDARPPAELSRRILDAAQAAALSSAKTTARPAAGSWARVRAWLASGIEGLRHPGVTAAFASLMLATVIGVMWRDGPPPETEPAHDRAAPAARSTESPASQAPAVAPPAAPTADARDASAAAARRDDETRREVAPPRPRATAPTPSIAPAAKATAEVAGPPPHVTPPTPSIAAQATAPTAPSDRARATAQNQAAAPAGGAATEGGTPDERRPSAVAPEDDPLAAPIAALRGSSGAGAPARLARRAEADAAAVLPSALAWFGDAQALTRGQWRPVTADTSAARPAAWTEALSTDGRALGRVAILDGALWWQPAGEDGRTWRAPLPAGSVAQRLGEALASGALDRPPSRP